MTNKTEFIKFRCTPEQKSAIEDKAAKYGVDVSVLCRMSSLLVDFNITEIHLFDSSISDLDLFAFICERFALPFTIKEAHLDGGDETDVIIETIYFSDGMTGTIQVRFTFDSNGDFVPLPDVIGTHYNDSNHAVQLDDIGGHLDDETH